MKIDDQDEEAEPVIMRFHDAAGERADLGHFGTVARLLLDFGAVLEPDDPEHEEQYITPLHVTCDDNQLQVARLFLDRGAKVDVETRIVKLLLDGGADVNCMDAEEDV
ncbi:unnamed protein product [Cylindrotheca closterium]|uniref:Uncharacterized protein n=1 Tax=Cylindrotheca closterium TaxID=2856 RepID=A0AAD2G5C7_9STRA|nr:unnamed protein product [Cylindrotheca closterium]